MTSIVIAEDHQSLIDGLSLLFENDPAFQIIGKANDGQRLIDIIKKRQPDVVLTDIRMPKIDGIVVTKMMKRMYPTLKVIAFTMFDEQESIKQMMEAGANGYILKNSGLVDVKEAIEIVMKGETYFDKSCFNGECVSSRIQNVEKLYNWLKSKGCELKIVSEISPAPNEIKTTL